MGTGIFLLAIATAFLAGCVLGMTAAFKGMMEFSNRIIDAAFEDDDDEDDEIGDTEDEGPWIHGNPSYTLTTSKPVEPEEGASRADRLAEREI
jgi:hypothetical protein